MVYQVEKRWMCNRFNCKYRISKKREYCCPETTNQKAFNGSFMVTYLNLVELFSGTFFAWASHKLTHASRGNWSCRRRFLRLPTRHCQNPSSMSGPKTTNLQGSSWLFQANCRKGVSTGPVQGLEKSRLWPVSFQRHCLLHRGPGQSRAGQEVQVFCRLWTCQVGFLG